MFKGFQKIGLGDTMFAGVPSIFNKQAKMNTGGIILWLKADIGVTLNGSTVSVWTDQSGNNNNAIQSNPSNQPLLVTGALNGLPVLRFDGLNDFMDFPDIITNKISFFCVFKKTSGTIGVLLCASTSPGTPSQTIENYTDGASYIVNHVGTNVSAPTGQINSYGVLTIVYANPNSEFFVNGISKGGTSNAMSITFNRIGFRTHQGWYLSGDIAEIILYDFALSNNERQNVEYYLLNKYAIAI